MLTRVEIKQAVTAANAAVIRWNGSDAPNVNWRGGTVKAISEEVLKHLDALVALTESAEDAEPRAREIVLAVDVLADALYAWAEASEVAPEAIHPSGTSQLWQAFQAVVEAAVDRPRRLPEPISDLVNLGVGLEQIAKQYGFLHEDGTPNLQMAVEERDKPGTHYNAETWVHPADRRRQAEIDAQWAQRQPSGRARLVEEPRQPRIAPEPLDDLIAQDVPAEQIARMKQITVDEVHERAAAMGVALGGKFRRPPTVEAREREIQEVTQRQSERYPQSHPEMADMNDRILACHLDDMKPAEIAEALQPDYPSLTWQKVNAVIREAEKDPASR